MQKKKGLSKKGLSDLYRNTLNYQKPEGRLRRKTITEGRIIMEKRRELVKQFL